MDAGLVGHADRAVSGKREGIGNVEDLEADAQKRFLFFPELVELSFAGGEQVPGRPSEFAVDPAGRGQFPHEVDGGTTRVARQAGSVQSEGALQFVVARVDDLGCP
jgi:hypothetical protein